MNKDDFLNVSYDEVLKHPSYYAGVALDMLKKATEVKQIIQKHIAAGNKVEGFHIPKSKGIRQIDLDAQLEAHILKRIGKEGLDKVAPRKVKVTLIDTMMPNDPVVEASTKMKPINKSYVKI